MITLIEVLNYRCLRYVRQTLEPFQVLVGPNASGKSAFLDVPAFLGDMLSDGLATAVGKRTANPWDLVWMHIDERIEIAVEARIPQERRALLNGAKYDTVRYELAFGMDPDRGELHILAERAMLMVGKRGPKRERALFPELQEPPKTIVHRKPIRISEGKLVLSKVHGKNDNYYSESHKKAGKGWMPSIRLGPRKSALGNLPEDESDFPVLTWFKGLLESGVQQLVLNSAALRKASPPGLGRGFIPDGSNLPWVIDELMRKSKHAIREWVEHLRTALPDLRQVDTIERKDDRHRYLVLEYAGGLKIPSWMASDGTLRLLALTLPAYLADTRGIYLIEEPENGIHPRAIETAYHSLSSVYDAQVLLATHSPVILSLVEASKALCFGKTAEGATDIVPGDKHPKLKNWRGSPNLSVLFAGGVLE